VYAERSSVVDQLVIRPLLGNPKIRTWRAVVFVCVG
jgi:hypothetical protein